MLINTPVELNVLLAGVSGYFLMGRNRSVTGGEGPSQVVTICPLSFFGRGQIAFQFILSPKSLGWPAKFGQAGENFVGQWSQSILGLASFYN